MINCTPVGCKNNLNKFLSNSTGKITTCWLNKMFELFITVLWVLIYFKLNFILPQTSSSYCSISLHNSFYYGIFVYLIFKLTFKHLNIILFLVIPSENHLSLSNLKYKL